MAGMPQASAAGMPQIPPDQLAKLPPEQRARVEAALKQAGNIASGKPITSTNKHCVNKEDLTRMNPMGNADKSCKMTVTNSSSSRFEAKVVCDSPDNKSTSSITVEAPGPESSKFSLVSTGTANGHPMNMTVNGTGKWLGATCSDTK